MKTTNWVAVILALCCVFALSACDKSTKNPSEGLEYTLNPDSESYSVSDIGTCTDTNVVIPSIYKGKPVTSIGVGAFYDCSDLTSITIPDSVTSIGELAFRNCISLESIIIPDSVTSIGAWAFSGCAGLTNITIPDSVTSIGVGAFSGTEYIYNADNWVDGVLYIGNHLIAAQKDTLPANFAIKTGTTCIADFAFCYCDGLTSITIPAGVTSIGRSAFYDCSGLTSITIPDSVTSIGEWAFSGTEYFYNADNWVDGVLYIDNHLIVAQQDTLPANFAIKTGTTCIADGAFSRCSGLTSITIPDSVTIIGDFAFRNCNSLTNITFGGTQAQWNDISKDENWNSRTGAYTIHCTDGDISE